MIQKHKSQFIKPFLPHAYKFLVFVRSYGLGQRRNFWKTGIQNTWERLSESFWEFYSLPLYLYSAGGDFFRNRHQKHLRMVLRSILRMLFATSLFRRRRVFEKNSQWKHQRMALRSISRMLPVTSLFHQRQFFLNWHFKTPENGSQKHFLNFMVKSALSFMLNSILNATDKIFEKWAFKIPENRSQKHF